MSPANKASELWAVDRRPEITAMAHRVVELAIRSGADAAEVVIGTGSELGIKVRVGEIEHLHEAQSRNLGLRVFREQRSSLTYTSDFGDTGLATFVQNAVALSRLAEPDPLNELPDSEELWPRGQSLPDLKLWDEETLSLDASTGVSWARAAEAAALGMSPKLRAGDGASFGRTISTGAFACGDRRGVLFAGGKRGTYQSLSVDVLCDDDTPGSQGKKRGGSYYTGGRFRAELEDISAVGREAGRRALSRLGATKIATGELPIVIDPEVGRSLLRILAQVASGGAVYRKASYLCDREGTQVASPLVSVVDDPLLLGGPGSRPYDGDGLPTRRNQLVEGGMLKTYLLDTYAARKLGRKSNGCAGRSGSGAPHVTTSNLILLPGDLSPEALLRDIPYGLYVTEMMGFGFNAVTGDFSRGVGGFLIEHGEKTRPVSEVTLALHFDELLKRIDGVGNDLDRRASVMVPTLRISRAMIAGK